MSTWEIIGQRDRELDLLRSLGRLRMNEKIGRNDPCPCGSGKKYKKCHGGIVTAPRARVAGPPPRQWKPYTDLPGYEKERRTAIEELFRDEFAFIDDCLGLAAKQVEVLGQVVPASVEDASMRDVTCDAFEFLYESRKALAENRPSIVFPSMRRAFESTCLCHLFAMKPEFAAKWADGREISNTDVRKALEHDPMTESVDQLKEQYKHFSQGTRSCPIGC